MKTWDDWSDWDINTELTTIIFSDMLSNLKISETGRYFYYKTREGWGTQDVLDYCNTPNDMWPLMIDSGIVVLPYDTCERYIAVSGATLNSDHNLCSDNIWYLDEKPLRAAAIVFLEINGVKP